MRARATRLAVILAVFTGSATIVAAQTEKSIGEQLEDLLVAKTTAVSYSAVQKLGAGAVPVLAAVLSDASARAQWERAVIALGLTCNSSAAEGVLQFLMREHPAPRREELAALLAVPTALGQLANAGSDKALQVLVGWDVKRLGGLSLDEAAMAEFRQRMDSRHIEGLGFSAHEEATIKLRSRLQSTSATAQFDTWRSLRRGLQLSERVKKQGLPTVLATREQVDALVSPRLRVSYKAVRALGSVVVPDLITMLDDDVEEQRLANVVTVLGYVGDSDSVPSLERFLRTQKGEVSIERFQALLLALPALGHIAHRGDNAAFALLQQYATRQAEAPGFSHGQYVGPLVIDALQKLAIQGLGISGRDEAVDVLIGLRSRHDFPTHLHDNVEEALNLIRKLKTQTADTIFGG